jgi:UDP-glucuronate 4-epimerase
MTPYYDRRLKEARHAILQTSNRFTPVIAQLEDMDALERAADLAAPDIIVHLAAQAGVRYSIEAPRAYVESNLVGSFNLLEVARRMRPGHLLLASTSSVYGDSFDVPFHEVDSTESPLSLYAATKKGMEVMSHSYAHLWSLPTTCFRFFTGYGPWGRPDMALFTFVRAIERGEPIEIYGRGGMRRDFTYIDDLVEAVTRLIDRPPLAGDPVQSPDAVDTLSAVAPWRVVNIAGGNPIDLMDFVEAIERALGKTARKLLLPMQPGDVTETFADHHLLQALTGYRPSTPLDQGIAAFVRWFRTYYSEAHV